MVEHWAAPSSRSTTFPSAWLAPCRQHCPQGQDPGAEVSTPSRNITAVTQNFFHCTSNPARRVPQPLSRVKLCSSGQGDVLRHWHPSIKHPMGHATTVPAHSWHQATTFLLVECWHWSSAGHIHAEGLHATAPPLLDRRRAGVGSQCREKSSCCRTVSAMLSLTSLELSLSQSPKLPGTGPRMCPPAWAPPQTPSPHPLPVLCAHG